MNEIKKIHKLPQDLAKRENLKFMDAIGKSSITPMAKIEILDEKIFNLTYETYALQSQLTAAQAENERLKEAIDYMLKPYPNDIFPEWPYDKMQAVIKSMTEEQRLYLTNSNGVMGRHVCETILRKYDELTEVALKE